MDPKYYIDVYLLIVTLCTLLLLAGIKSKKVLLYNSKPNHLFGLLLLVLLVFFIGFRPVSFAFVDMVNYYDFYQAIYYNSHFKFNPYSENFIFDNIFAWLGSKCIDISFFYVFMAFLYFSCMYGACRKFFSNNYIIAFLVCLAAFSTFSYGTNGLKAGVAGSIFLLGIAYHENKLLAFLFLFCSLGFHHSMVLPIAAYIMVTFYKKTKLYMLMWIVCCLLSAFHVTFFQVLFAGFSDDSGSSYLNDVDGDWGGKTGFRIDFLVYSAVPILMGYWLIFKKRLQSEGYKLILNLYLVTNSVWILCMYAAFTNRIAYLSWFMYPVVLVYPLLNLNITQNQHLLFKKVVLAHLGFTLFMQYIYY